MKRIKKLNFNKIIDFFSIFILISVFLLGDKEASFYEKSILPIWEQKLPEDLQLIRLHTDYSINLNDDFSLGIISPNAPFALNDSVYVKRLLEYCIYKDFMSVLVRTKENDLKIITLKSKPHKEGIIPLNEMFEYKIFTPKDFYNDTTIFDKPWKYYVPCNNLRYPPGLVNVWGFLGRSILFLLIIMVSKKIYLYFYKLKNKTY